MRLVARLAAITIWTAALLLPARASAIALHHTTLQVNAVREASNAKSAPPEAAADPAPVAVTVDSIVERIEDDIITDSQVVELQNFQKLLGGQPKDRDRIIEELTDQWIIRNEAENSQFRAPAQEAENHAFTQVTSKFPSQQAMDQQLARLGLTESDAKRMVAQELYLTSFLDFKFRPEAQIIPDQIEAYYRDTLVSELKGKGEQLPPLASVEDQIREVLTQKAIDQRTQQWLEETRSRLQIERVSPKSQP
jgi:hypothetical protein